MKRLLFCCWLLGLFAPISQADDSKWAVQAAEDAKQDWHTFAYDGVSPNKLVCDTTLRELPDGSWILYLLAGGETEPLPENYTGVTRSADHGHTWSPLQVFDTGLPRTGDTIGQGPSELMILNGRSTLFFATHAGHWAHGWRSWYRTSDDSCRTWGPLTEVPGELRERTFIRNHIVTHDGRIMVPFQHYIGPDDEQAKPPLDRDFTNPRNGVLISQDGGKTWTQHGQIRLTPNDRYFGWAENNLAELADGRIAMIIRGDQLGGVLYQAISSDGGLTWPEFATKTDIPNPGSKATLYPLGGNTVAMLHNPNPRHRSPLSLWISFDGMKTWPYQRVLVAESTDGPAGRLNYPDGFVSQDKQWLNFAYDDNRHRAAVYAAKLPPLPSPDLGSLLAHPIIDPHLPLAEVDAYAEPRVAAMPAVQSKAEWEGIAAKLREKVLREIVFRGQAARQWRDAKTKVERLETIAGGPGYHVVKLRYEALPGLWIPALLYEPDQPGDKMPVHLAVNGHESTGKSTPYIQLRCINLAKRGIATLNPEWFSKGQIKDDLHQQMNQLDLCGESGLAPFYLAMSRGLDLLLALPGADPRRVAVSGLSGGGWQTITISSLDPRVTFCNPVAGYSSVKTRTHFPSDLGDSEQAPCDLATIADYTHLTAMLAGRGALLTFNEHDNCCFAAPHALEPLLNAAGPIFALYGQSARLRNHVNYDPGTHNYEMENREAFYGALGAEFYPGDPHFQTREIPSESEVKTAAQLDVAMPDGNLTFNRLALQLSQSLPRERDLATKDPEAARAKLAAIVTYKKEPLVAQPAGTETYGSLRVNYWKLRIGNAWTVPAVELARGEPRGTTLLMADRGRKSAGAEVEKLLAAGQRVIALDPFYFGESKIEGRDNLLAMLLDTVGVRPLGVQAGQVAAVARWAKDRFGHSAPVQVVAIGPRTSTFALVATALEPGAIGQLRRVDPLTSLRQVLEKNWTMYDTPELLCFGLLEAFDVPQLEELAGPARLELSAMKGPKARLAGG